MFLEGLGTTHQVQTKMENLVMAKPTLEFQNVLAKPFGEIKKKEHTFAEALDHFAEVIGSQTSRTSNFSCLKLAVS